MPNAARSTSAIPEWDLPRLHRPSTVADRLDTSLSTVRRLVRLGKLEAVYIGASMRITETSIGSLMRSGTRRAKPRGKR